MRLRAGLALAAIASVLVGAPCVVGAAGSALSGVEAKQICLAERSGGSAVDDALRGAQAAARQMPAKPEAWVRVGWQWVRTARLATDPGFYVNVVACADEALRLAPTAVAARELRALAAMNGHRFDDARREAETILAAEPESPIALGIASDALLELGRFDEAVATAQRGADILPDSAAHARASYFHWLAGDKDGAKRFIRAALSGRDRRDPEPAAWTFVEAAKIFWHEADYAGADAVLDEALRWVADYPPALVMRGRVALSRGLAGRAIVDLEKAHRVQPLPETAWLLADARSMAGDAAGAETEHARVVQSGNRNDRLTLALFYATKNRDAGEALKLVEEERATRGGVYVDDVYAWTLYRAGRLDEARRASDRAMRLGTPDARILYHAGAIRLAAGDSSGRALVEKALVLNPQFDVTGAAEARGLLASTTGGDGAAVCVDSEVERHAS